MSRHSRQYWTKNRSAIDEVKEVAAKVNATLIAKGKLKPSQLSSPTTVIPKKPIVHHGLAQHSRGGGPVLAEVEINDCPVYCRNTLTRGTTQDDISRFSNSAISTKGRHMSNEERLKNPGERPLYLCIQGPTADAVDAAIMKIHEIIKIELEKNGFNNADISKFISLSSPRTQSVQTASVGSTNTQLQQVTVNCSSSSTVAQPTIMVQDKVNINLEHAPPSFDVKSKVFGPSGQYLQHIQNESGARVTLRGRGSGDPLSLDSTEPMNIHLQHTTLAGLQHAKQLAEDLVQTVQKDFAAFQQALAAQPPNASIAPSALVQTVDFYQSPVQSVPVPPPPMSLPNTAVPPPTVSQFVQPVQEIIQPSAHPTYQTVPMGQPIQQQISHTIGQEYFVQYSQPIQTDIHFATKRHYPFDERKTEPEVEPVPPPASSTIAEYFVQRPLTVVRDQVQKNEVDKQLMPPPSAPPAFKLPKSNRNVNVSQAALYVTEGDENLTDVRNKQTVTYNQFSSKAQTYVQQVPQNSASPVEYAPQIYGQQISYTSLPVSQVFNVHTQPSLAQASTQQAYYGQNSNQTPQAVTNPGAYWA